MITSNGHILSRSRWHFALWGALAAILLLPLVAMRFTDSVRWDAADFAAGGSLLLAFGLITELTVRRITRRRTRMALVGAGATVVLIIWADAAVGIF